MITTTRTLQYALFATLALLAIVLFVRARNSRRAVSTTQPADPPTTSGAGGSW